MKLRAAHDHGLEQRDQAPAVESLDSYVFLFAVSTDRDHPRWPKVKFGCEAPAMFRMISRYEEGVGPGDLRLLLLR